MRLCPVFIDQLFRFFFVQQGKYLYVFFRILIAAVQPELVESVGGGFLRVKPYIS